MAAFLLAPKGLDLVHSVARLRLASSLTGQASSDGEVSCRRRMKKAADEALAGTPFNLTVKNKKGKYTSMRIDTRVSDEKQRNAIFAALKGNPVIRYIL